MSIMAIAIKLRCCAGDFGVKVQTLIGIDGSRCGRFEPAMELLRLGTVKVAPLIAGRFPLSAAPEAFARAAEKGVLKVLLNGSV